MRERVRHALFPADAVGARIDGDDSAGLVFAGRTQAVAGLRQRVGGSHISEARVNPAGALTERMMIPVRAAAMPGIDRIGTSQWAAYRQPRT